MASIRARVQSVKGDPFQLIDPAAVERACREAGHRRRERTLDPVSTLRAFAAQIAHGNTAIAQVVRLMGEAGVAFSESAYCQARARLPVAVVRAAFDAFTARARDARRPGDGLWCGHRTALIDGSDVNTPDTPELRGAFGVSGNCAPGAGLPSVHTLTLFDAHGGCCWICTPRPCTHRTTATPGTCTRPCGRGTCWSAIGA